MNESLHPDNKKALHLPVHTPDAALWQRIEAQLDALDADDKLAQKLEELPVHKPEPGTWNMIVARMNRSQRVRKVVLWTSAAAASLLVLFTAVKLSDINLNSRQNNLVSTSTTRQAIKKAVATGQNQVYDNIQKTEIQPVTQIAQNKHNKSEKRKINTFGSSKEQEVSVTTAEPVYEYSFASDELPVIFGLGYPDIIENNDFVIASADEIKLPVVTALKYYTPPEKTDRHRAQRMALAMNYQPENIGNGNGNSLFHNVDLAASYDKEKVRFNTSIGVAYNQEHYDYELNYNQLMPVTAVGPTGKIDTVDYLVNNVNDDYAGVLDHRYLTYNLGVGRRLFATGRLSGWLNAGAGFALKIDNSVSHESTVNTLKIMYNAVVHDVSETKSLYNASNITLATGIDLNYRMFDRVSLTLAPTGRWYFKPMFTQNNQPTDEFTVGFRTGLKFDF